MLQEMTLCSDASFREPLAGSPPHACAVGQRLRTKHVRSRWIALVSVVLTLAVGLMFAIIRRVRAWDGCGGSIFADNVLPCVEISAGNGRLGNNMHEVFHGLYFAKQAGITMVKVSCGSRQLQQILDLPNLLHLPQHLKKEGPISEECWGLAHVIQDKHQPGRFVSGFWEARCDPVYARQYHDLAKELIWPMFKAALVACIKNNDTNPEPQEQTLTVHLRSDDMWVDDHGGKIPSDAVPNHWLWQNPPCSLYEKVIAEEGFRHVLVVTSSDRLNPCVSWLEKRATRSNYSFRVQSKTLLEDSCALLRARNLFLSYSTFPESMAVLSLQVQRIFSRTQFQQYSAMDDLGWPGTSIEQYHVPIHEGHLGPYSNTMQGVRHWMLTYPASKITKYRP